MYSKTLIKEETVEGKVQYYYKVKGADIGTFTIVVGEEHDVDQEIESALNSSPEPFVETYATKRKQEYPTWEAQLDYIYHNGVEAWKTDIIDPIKAKYPKPT